MQVATQRVRAPRFEIAYACPAALPPANDDIAPILLRDFPGLARLLGQGEDKLLLVLRTFHRFLVMDLFRMKRAAEDHAWADVRHFANRLAMACMQVHAFDAAGVAMVLGAAGEDADTQRRYHASEQQHLSLWLALIDRAARVIGQANRTHAAH